MRVLGSLVNNYDYLVQQQKIPRVSYLHQIHVREVFKLPIKLKNTQPLLPI